MINSNDKQGLTNLLQNFNYKKANDLLSATEYREKFDGERLYTASK